MHKNFIKSIITKIKTKENGGKFETIIFKLINASKKERNVSSMELIGTNAQEKNKKTKKIMIGIIITIVLLLIASFIILGVIYYLKQGQFKLYIDGKVSKTSDDLFIFEGDTVYVSIRDIANMVGYQYYNGGYKQYTEDETKCYVESENEVCTLEMDSTIIYKTPPENLDYEYYTLTTPVKRINGKLYITAEGISVACNLKFYYDANKNQVTIYTLPYYTNYYVTNYKTSAISENFKNQKALLYNLLVVQNIDNTQSASRNIRYGVYKIGENGITEVVGTKYTDIEFIESTQEFIVKTTENQVGIITADGKTKVQPQYDSLKQIDKDLNLYLATSNNKKGVIEKNGKILIYLEYDEIGLDTSKFQDDDIKNPYILYNNAIPVKQNGKWGMYDIRGNLILPIEYDGFGCITNDKTKSSILLIPDVKAIVVSKLYDIEKQGKQNYYGVVDFQGKVLMLTGLQSVYSVTNNGIKEYTMIYNDVSYDAIESILNNALTIRNTVTNEE